MAETLDATTTTDLTYDSASWWWKRLDAKDDADKTNEDTPKNIDVLANDVGASSIVKVDGKTVTAYTAPVTLESGATVDLTVDPYGKKTLLYDPGEAFQGLDSGESETDTFTYTVAGKYKGTDTATVKVAIDGITDDDPSTNEAPVANDDKAYLPSYYPYPLPYEETAESIAVTTIDAPTDDDLIFTTLAIGEEGDPYPYPSSVDIKVLVNDTDADGNPLHVDAIAGNKVDTDSTTDLPDTVTLKESGATVKLNADGSLTYTENGNVYVDPVPLAEEDAMLTTNSDGSGELVQIDPILPPEPWSWLVDSFTYSASDGKLSDEATVDVYRMSGWYVLDSADPVA